MSDEIEVKVNSVLAPEKRITFTVSEQQARTLQYVLDCLDDEVYIDWETLGEIRLSDVQIMLSAVSDVLGIKIER